MERLIPGPKSTNPILFLLSIPNPSRWLLETTRTYGEIFAIDTVLGPMVYSGAPEVARVLFTTDQDAFEPSWPDTSAPFLGEASLVLVSGARHKRDRKLLSPPFNGARMRTYGALMADACERVAQRWQRGQPFKMLEMTQALSLDIILRAVFGLDATEKRTEEVRRALIDFIEAISPLIVFFQAIRRHFFGFGPWARFCRASERLDALLYDVISSRRKEPAPREDILSLMMSARYEDGGSMSDKDLRDELLTLLFAGHETTAIALAWAFYWLHKDPAELGRVLDELGTLGPHPEPDAVAALPYLDAVCQETLRIHPIVADIPRTLRRPLDVLGYTVPAGVALTASVLLAHSRPDLYPEPERFRPSRFLERKFTPFEFMPFGGGARRCIGSAFALYEMKIALAKLLPTRHLRLAPGPPPRAARRGLTMGPANGIPMIYDGPRAGAL